MNIWIFAAVVIVVVVIDLPVWLKLVLIAGLTASQVQKPSAQAHAYEYERYADEVVKKSVRSRNKLAKSLAYIFTPNAETGDFDDVMEGVSPEKFVAAMHTLVKIKDADGKLHEETPFDTLIRENKYMLSELLKYYDEVDDNFMIFVLELQANMIEYFKVYFDMLKITNQSPPAIHSDDGYDNDLEFSLHEAFLSIDRKIADREVENPFLRVINMYEAFKAPVRKRQRDDEEMDIDDIMKKMRI